MTEHRIIQGDVLDGLRTLPDCCVQEVITSPPYYGLRDYGVDGQIGLESSLQEYIGKLVEVSRELRRVLRDDGAYLLNLGDCYAGSGKGPSKSLNAKNPHSHIAAERRKGLDKSDSNRRSQKYNLLGGDVPGGLKAKDLMGVPWRVAFALQDDGWYLRSDIIWAKPNCMPSSVKDRPTTSHEYIFLLTKKPRYFWDGEAIREPVSESYAKDKRPVGILRQRVNKNTKYPRTGQFKQQKLSGRAARPPGTRENNLHKGPVVRAIFRGGGKYTEGQSFDNSTPVDNQVPGNVPNLCLSRNARSVWVISPQPRPEAHFATFPDELARRCIKAGTSEKGCCPSCGAPYRRIVVATGGTIGKSWTPHDDDLGVGAKCGAPSAGYHREFLGWEPTCKCEAGDPVPCTVLDPFMGSGTVACMARDLGRNSIGTEINAEYIAIARHRLRADEQIPAGNRHVEYRFEKVAVAVVEGGN